MKRKISSSANIPAFRDSVDNMSRDSQIFVDKSLAIAHYLQLLMQHQGLRQKDLAALMGKTEAELSKWLAGMHNYTLRSLAKLEAALGADIIVVPGKIEHPTPQVEHPIHCSLGNKYSQPKAVSSTLNYQAPGEVQKGGVTAEEKINGMAA
jgi:transcriptional regulator with XRE-family HTH domain